MGLKYYSKEVSNSNEFPPLSSNTDVPMYANIYVPYHKEHQSPIQPLPSEPSSLKKTYADIHTYTSISKQDTIAPSTQTSHCPRTNIYSNTSKLLKKPRDISDETTYGKLGNTTSITDIPINPHTLDENNNNRIYENLSSHSTSTIPPKINESITHPNPSSSAHIYINFDHPRNIPLSSSKNDQQEEIHYSPLCPIAKKPVDIDTSSNTNTIKTGKKLEVNNCGDKSVLSRTKIPPTITQIHPSFRQRRTSHHSKRHRRRSTTPFRAAMNSNAMRRQQQQQHRPVLTHDRRKRPVQQMKSISNRLYNEIQQPILPDNQSINSIYSEKGIEVFEYPTQFHASVTTSNIRMVRSASENGESNHQDEITDKEEELFSHNTFEDFLLRRRPSKSSSSTSTSETSTVISQARPVRPPPLSRRSSGVALSLDKNDVDFIHDIIQRTHGDQRVSNRITALREAYIRAAIKRNDVLKTKPIAPIDQNKKKKTTTAMKHSFMTSKIHDELERYDELPIHRRTMFDYDSDDTYSANDDYRFRHRTLPATPSTAHRIISFISTVKRQLQKSFHDIRSRILIETMTMSSNHVARHRHIFQDPSMLSRRRISRPKTSHDMIQRNNSHHSIEHSYPLHRHQLYRAHSNTSQLPSQHQHVRYPSSFEQHSSHRSQIFRTTPRQERSQRIG